MVLSEQPTSASASASTAADVIDSTTSANGNQLSQSLFTVTKIKSPRCQVFDGTNFFIWNSQFLTILKGHGLTKYIQGKVSITADSLEEQKDSLIKNWIYTSLSPTIMSQVAALDTSAQVWDALQSLFASGSETRLLLLRHNLQSIRKENLSVIDYLKKITLMRDQLACGGEKMKDSQIILIALGGLGLEFHASKTSITTRFDHSMSFLSSQQLLLDHKPDIVTVVNPEVNAVGRIAAGPSRSGGRDLWCQICSKKGHSAKNCFNRINLSKYPPDHYRTLSPNGPYENTNRDPSVNMVSTGHGGNARWYQDTAATASVTQSSNNLHSIRP